MSQHFLPSSRAKTLTLASVARMSDEEAEAVFRKIRWANNDGNPFCPKCGCTIVYDCRRANGTARWRSVESAADLHFLLTVTRIYRGMRVNGVRVQTWSS